MMKALMILIILILLSWAFDILSWLPRRAHRLRR